MSLAITQTRSIVGISARIVNVEVHLSNGLPSFSIVGLPQAAVKESKDRVRSAIINSNFDFPCRRITINLAPADLPKAGCGFDLPIALGILAASAQIPQNKLSDHEFIGELALDGGIRAVNVIIPAIVAAKISKNTIIIPHANTDEASLIGYTEAFSAENLSQVCGYLRNFTTLTPLPVASFPEDTANNIDWADIKGQQNAKYAMEIAASGGHSILLNGPPGSGKTMLAKRFNTILPDLSINQALECMAIKAISGMKLSINDWKLPPLRSPHHTASPIALVGGSNPPKPGEISLAHNGVLFLDELPEFDRNVLETLREPLEAGTICISRAAVKTEFPAKFQLLAAMNPCPCGQFGNPNAHCKCSEDKISKYIGKLSAPLLDRIDMILTLLPLNHLDLFSQNKNTKTSQIIKEKVIAMRKLQMDRQGTLNAQLSGEKCLQICKLGNTEKEYFYNSLTKLNLSARSTIKILKVSRTIADMHARDEITIKDIQQALSFKQNLKNPS